MRSGEEKGTRQACGHLRRKLCASATVAKTTFPPNSQPNVTPEMPHTVYSCSHTCDARTHFAVKQFSWLIRPLSQTEEDGISSSAKLITCCCPEAISLRLLVPAAHQRLISLKTVPPETRRYTPPKTVCIIIASLLPKHVKKI